MRWSNLLLCFGVGGCFSPNFPPGAETESGTESTGDAATSTTGSAGPTGDTSASSSTGAADETADATEDPTTGTDSTGSESDSTESADTGSDDTSNADPVAFVVTIENLSAGTPLAGAFSAGVWAEHESGASPLFEEDDIASDGLVLLAEDGDPSELAVEVGESEIISFGTFDTPRGARGPGALPPGGSYSFEFLAQPGSRLSFASSVVSTNDVFLGTDPLGVALFEANGDPVDGDITSSLALWDAGSEAQQPPGGGGYQMQGAGGPDESGAISVRDESTRAIPAARRLLDVDVALEAGTTNYVITFENISGDTGGLATALSGIAWATHDDTVSIVNPGGLAVDVPGLEALAEDGDPSGLAATLGAEPGEENSGALGGLLPIGDSISLSVTPSAAAPFLSFATMVVASNDAFVAPGSEGIRMLEDDGSARSASAIEADVLELVAVWDAGTEANQTPGAGADQPLSQAAPDTGEDDADPTVRFYHDETNDLEDPSATLLVEVNPSVAVPGQFTINFVQSGSDDFRFGFSSIVWGVSDGGAPFFQAGAAASSGLEALAEDELTTGFDQELGDAGFAPHGVAEPTSPGVYSLLFATSPDEPMFNMAAMVVPSNDTFIALGEDGIDLYGGGADPLEGDAIEALILEALGVYDAGTEQNQAGAAGRDMAPDGGSNTGAPEGPGTIRNVTPGVSGVLTNEPVWSYPSPQQLVRVTVAPAK